MKPFAKPKRQILLFCLFCLVPVWTPAFAAAKAQDSLAHYLLLAAQSNPLVMQRYYEYQASLQQIAQVAAPADPTLEAGIFLAPMEFMEGRQLAEFRLMQMFPWFGTLRASKDERSMMANARFEAFRAAKLQAMFSLQNQYYKLFLTAQTIQYKEENLQLLKSLHVLAITRFSGSVETSSGPATEGMSDAMAAPTGVQKADEGLLALNALQAEINLVETELALLQNKRLTQAADFNLTMNRHPLMPIYLPASLDRPIEPVSHLAMEDNMLQNNPILGMVNAESDALEPRMRMIRRKAFPMIGLGLNYMLMDKLPGQSGEMNGKDMLMPMVAITLPVFRPKYIAMQKETNQQQFALRQQSVESINALKSDYYKALQELEDSWVRAQLYEKQLALASQSLAVLTSGFAAGGRDLAEILQMRRQLLDYSVMQAEAQVGYHIARARIKWLAGEEPVTNEPQ